MKWFACLRLLLPALLLILLSGCATYSVKEIHGQVVDAETGQPLDGVIIVAQWLLDKSPVGDDKSLLKVMETVTDKNGNYAFPAWGTATLPSQADFRAGRDPRVVYFKFGYWPTYMQNELLSDIRHRVTPLGGFQGNGKTVRLMKCDCKGEEYWTHIRTLAGDMPVGYGADWKNYPHMTWAIEQVNRQYKASGNQLSDIQVDGFKFDNLSARDREYLMRFTPDMPVDAPASGAQPGVVK